MDLHFINSTKVFITHSNVYSLWRASGLACPSVRQRSQTTSDTGPPRWELNVGLNIILSPSRKCPIQSHLIKSEKLPIINKDQPQIALQIKTWYVGCKNTANLFAGDAWADGLNKYNIDIVALQETQWPFARRTKTKHQFVYYRHRSRQDSMYQVILYDQIIHFTSYEVGEKQTNRVIT